VFEAGVRGVGEEKFRKFEARKWLAGTAAPALLFGQVKFIDALIFRHT
jgi:hypothetical protein